jgi:hypothetical protein
LKSIDEYIKNYIARFSKDINNEFFKNKTNEPEQNNSMNTMNTIEMFRFENIIKYRNDGNWEINMKSYLDRQSLDSLYKKKLNNKYIFTFNISNIYFGNASLLPLVKCNKCEYHF